jgi:hypothetical protein
MAVHTSSLTAGLYSSHPVFAFQPAKFWACPSPSVFGLAFCMPSAETMICLQTWADWKSIPIFYFMYDWLLGLLEDALSPLERPHSVTITAAWQHMLCVAFLGSGIFLVAAFRLAWLLLVYCYKGKIFHCTPPVALGSLLYMWSTCYSLPGKSLPVHVCRGVLYLRAHSVQRMSLPDSVCVICLLLPVCA